MDLNIINQNVNTFSLKSNLNFRGNNNKTKPQENDTFVKTENPNKKEKTKTHTPSTKQVASIKQVATTGVVAPTPSLPAILTLAGIATVGTVAGIKAYNSKPPTTQQAFIPYKAPTKTLTAKSSFSPFMHTPNPVSTTKSKNQSPKKAVIIPALVAIGASIGAIVNNIEEKNQELGDKTVAKTKQILASANSAVGKAKTSVSTAVGKAKTSVSTALVTAQKGVASAWDSAKNKVKDSIKAKKDKKSAAKSACEKVITKITSATDIKTLQELKTKFNNEIKHCDKTEVKKLKNEFKKAFESKMNDIKASSLSDTKSNIFTAVFGCKNLTDLKQLKVTTYTDGFEKTETKELKNFFNSLKKIQEIILTINNKKQIELKQYNKLTDLEKHLDTTTYKNIGRYLPNSYTDIKTVLSTISAITTILNTGIEKKDIDYYIYSANNSLNILNKTTITTSDEKRLRKQLTALQNKLEKMKTSLESEDDSEDETLSSNDSSPRSTEEEEPSPTSDERISSLNPFDEGSRSRSASSDTGRSRSLSTIDEEYSDYDYSDSEDSDVELTEDFEDLHQNLINMAAIEEERKRNEETIAQYGEDINRNAEVINTLVNRLTGGDHGSTLSPSEPSLTETFNSLK